MYYKIENKDNITYQKLHALRSKELQIEKDNDKAISEKIPYKWEGFLGESGQQTISRVRKYIGFEFTNPSEVDLKIWKEHKEHKGCYIPNKRTKLGKEMNHFLSYELGSSFFKNVFEILGVESHRRFTFPYVEIAGDTVLVYLGNNEDPRHKDLIEITRTEFETLNEIA